MIRYLDSGLGGPNDCLGRWLDSVLVAGIQSFRGQFGFFDISALRKYLPVLTDVLVGGGKFSLVLGSNGGAPPTVPAIEALLPLLAHANATLTVVGYANSLFHPKTIHLTQAGGTAAAFVGSANLTSRGLGHNVEAGIVLEEDEATKPALDRIAAAVDRWEQCQDSGVYQVKTQAHIDALSASGLLLSEQASRRLRSLERSGTSITGRGSRVRGWTPPKVGVEEPDLPDGDAFGDFVPPIPPNTPQQQLVAHWCKQLNKSDAKQPSSGSHATAKLRLSKSRFPIDHKTYFRDEFFGGEPWAVEYRGGKSYEVAHIRLHVSAPGKIFGELKLLVDHAPHRVAAQNNVPTVLAWGPDLGKWLEQNNQVGSWVILEKDITGRYWLTIQSNKPGWAP